MTASAKVSILVPVYNVARFLPQCLDSLLAQTLDGIEIICVNDGSTDASPAILRSYAARDGRIRVINKENSGYGASMNRALDAAVGEFVAIVESDDYAEPSMVSRLHRMAVKHGCDLVKSNYFEHYDGRDHRFPNFKGFRYGWPFDPADIPQVIFTVPAIWTGLYRREMLLREGIRFRETPGAAFQDTSFTLKAWFASRVCALVRKPLLHYRMDNPASSVKTSDKALVVCDELAEAERFLRERPARCERFIDCFHRDKWGKYRWNYERVAPSLRVKFVGRMQREYRAAREAGELDRALFSIEDWTLLGELQKLSPENFAAAHPKRI